VLPVAKLISTVGDVLLEVFKASNSAKADCVKGCVFTDLIWVLKYKSKPLWTIYVLKDC